MTDTDLSKPQVRTNVHTNDPSNAWMLWIPPRGLVDYQDGDTTDGGELLGSFGETFWSTQQEACDHLDLVRRTHPVDFPPPVVEVNSSTPGSWTVVIRFAGQPILGMIYDADCDAQLGGDHGCDPKLVVWGCDEDGDEDVVASIELPEAIGANWHAIHRHHLDGTFWAGGPELPPPPAEEAPK